MARKKTQIITNSDEEEEQTTQQTQQELMHQLAIEQENLEAHRIRHSRPVASRLRRRAKSPSPDRVEKPIFSSDDDVPRSPKRVKVVPLTKSFEGSENMKRLQAASRKEKTIAKMPENLISWSDFKRGNLKQPQKKKLDHKPSVAQTKKDTSRQSYIVPLYSSPSPPLSHASTEESLEGFVIRDKLLNDAPLYESDSSEDKEYENMFSYNEEEKFESSSERESDVSVDFVRDELDRITRSSMNQSKFIPSLERSRNVQFERDLMNLRRIKDDEFQEEPLSAHKPEKRRNFNKFVLQETQAKDDESAPSTDDEDENFGIEPYSDDWIKRVSERLQQRTLEEEKAEQLKEELKGYNTRSNPHRFEEPISNLDEYETDPEEATDEEVVSDDEKDQTYMEEENMQANLPENCKSMQDARTLELYQQRPAKFVRHDSRNKSQFIVYGAGTGKTLAGLYLINQMIEHDRSRFPSKKPFKWLILVSAGLKNQWQEELDYQMLCNVLLKNLEKDETFQALEDLIQYQDRVKLVTPHELLNLYQVEDMHRYYIMVDEVQIYGYTPSSISKSTKGSRSDKTDEVDREIRQKNQIIGMIASSKSCFLLSATPLRSRITEMATYFWMLHLLGSDIDEAKLRSIADSITDVSHINDSKSRQELMRMMWDCFFLFYDVERQDPDLPRKQQELRCIPFTESQWRHYYEISPNDEKRFREDSGNPKRTHDYFSWIATRRCITDQKLQDVTELTKEKLSEHPTSKILIASKNISSRDGLAINRLLPYFDNENIEYFDLTIDSPDSDAKLKSFNEQRNVSLGEGARKKTIHSCRVALIGPKMSTGTDFKRVTHLILLEPDWIEQTTKQQIGRAVRMKSHRGLENSPYYNMVMIYRYITVRPQDQGGPYPLWQQQLETIMTDNPDDLHLEISASQYTIDQRRHVRGTILAKPLRDFLDQLRNMPLRKKCLQFVRTTFELEDLYKDSNRKTKKNKGTYHTSINKKQV